MGRPRVLVADDQPIVLECLRNLLEPVCDIVGEARNGLALLAAVEQLQPDMIVTDITMPRLDGIEAVRRIRKTNPKVKVVFLTVHAPTWYMPPRLCKPEDRPSS